MGTTDLVPGSARWRRTSEAVRGIRRQAIGDRNKKEMLAEWFREHRRAATSNNAKRAAYDQLLGRSRNRRLRG